MLVSVDTWELVILLVNASGCDQVHPSVGTMFHCRSVIKFIPDHVGVM